ncbi:MAG: multiheme c-type cytochrome [Anaerolineales bacterium]
MNASVTPPDKHWRTRTGAALIAIIAALMISGTALASPGSQESTPTPAPDADCAECHLDVAEHWEASPHAHAFDDETFQDWWKGNGQPEECLACHVTGYQESTGEYIVEGVSCEGCHGPAIADHPPRPVPIKADTEFCGICHTTTLSEWMRTGHAVEDVGCSDCHDPHSQKPLFAAADDLCINCHKEDMGDYLEDLHVQNDIGCVDCHALVIPPETPPDDGIVPTGHTFTISPATCVACHTDALHAGFALPGYEDGAAAANGGAETETSGPKPSQLQSESNNQLTAEQRVQTLETALASGNLTTLLQGSIVGVVLGASTAWFMANNVRRRGKREDDNEEQNG